jgi:hypothetical protein
MKKTVTIAVAVSSAPLTGAARASRGIGGSVTTSRPGCPSEKFQISGEESKQAPFISPVVQDSGERVRSAVENDLLTY